MSSPIIYALNHQGPNFFPLDSRGCFVMASWGSSDSYAPKRHAVGDDVAIKIVLEKRPSFKHLHPGRWTAGNTQITHFRGWKMNPTSMIMFHVNLPGCTSSRGFRKVWGCKLKGWTTKKGGKVQGVRHSLFWRNKKNILRFLGCKNLKGTEKNNRKRWCTQMMAIKMQLCI